MSANGGWHNLPRIYIMQGNKILFTTIVTTIEILLKSTRNILKLQNSFRTLWLQKYLPSALWSCPFFTPYISNFCNWNMLFSKHLFSWNGINRQLHECQRVKSNKCSSCMCLLLITKKINDDGLGNLSSYIAFYSNMN